MGRFDNSGLQQWDQQAANPAAPAGQRQAARAGRDFDNGSGRFADSDLGRFTSQNGYLDQAQSWYTGANQDGTNNGWDNQFVQDFIHGQEVAGREGTLGQYFEQKDATGVVTWDHTSSDGRHDFKFGDVFQKGQKVGNVFDQFDSDTANLMMADWLFDGKTKAEIFSASDAPARLAREVESKREQNNSDIPKALSAADFNEDVAARAKDFEDGHVDEAIVGGGVAGGAAVGAGVGAAAGALFGGLGALPGAVIGGGVGAAAGGVGALLNKDALAEQAARAYEITAMSSRENGGAAGFATGVTQWAGFGGRLISPASNLVQGAADAAYGKVGDGQSEFFRTDAAGDAVVPKWVKVADVGASLGDAALQFASPIGAGLYITQMTGTIAGEVGELALTGGKSFDYTRGGFDSIFTDDSGSFSPDRALAGIGKVGIDAVQLGMARGLMGKADAVLASTGQRRVYGSGLLGRMLGREEGQVAHAAGFKFRLGENGEVLGKRATLGLLAPSEQLQALSARVLASRAAAKRGGAYTADDFYRAATAMATGERRVTAALVNGFGEGYEEAAQAVLDPYSHNSAVSMEDIGSAAAYGFAMGAGMSLGTSARTPGADEKMFAQAKIAQLMKTGGSELTRSQWSSMSEVEKRGLAAMSDLERSTADAAFRKIAEDQAAEHTAGVVGVNKLADAIQSQLAQNLARATDRTDGAFVITQIEDAGAVDELGNLLPDSMPSDAVASSGVQLAHNLTNRLRGAAIQAEHLQRSLDQVAEQVAADPANQELLDTQAALTRQRDQISLMLAWGQRLDAELDVRLARMYDPAATDATIAAEAASLNEVLRRAFNLQLPDIGGIALTEDDKVALARAVSQVVARDPHDSAGSYQMLVPQVSAKLTAARSDNVLEISHAILPALRGDYDGDKVRTLNQLMLDETEFASARAGTAFLGAGASVNVGAPKYERYVVGYMAEALAGTNAALATYAAGTLSQIGTAVRARYDGVVEARVLDEVLEAFGDAVRAGSKDARASLLDGLADKAGGPITEFARGNLSNEWLWIDQLVRANLQAFQEGYAAHRPDLGPVPDSTLVAPNRQSTEVRERVAERAATLGQTLGQVTAGDSMFRKFQKLHYSSITAPVRTAGETEDSLGLAEMALLYEALGSGITRSELDEVRGKDDITARVYAQLRRLADDARQLHPQLNAVEALVVVANIRVLDIDVDADGAVSSNGQQVSLAQMLLKRSVATDRREKDSIFEASPELQAKHARLLAMTRPQSRDYPVNAERAFVEVVGAQQLFTLLGDDAYVFGPHLTVEQFLRGYVAQSELARRDTDRKLRGEAAYLGRKQSKNMPYDLDEVIGGDISAYRAVVDAILAVGHNRITIDEAGRLNGELAERSADTGAAFRDAHANVRSALQQFLGLSPRRDGELTTEVVARALESNPDFARQVMALIPNAAANAVFEVRDGEVFIANWVYDTFVIADSAEAEMHYWRNLLLSQWNALGAGARRNEEDGQAAREFSRLPRRMHRILWRLAAAPDAGLLLRKFVEEMESATSLEEFLRWVNTTPGIRGEQAPLTAWVDDVAEFDADKAQGGWTTSLEGAELREAVAALQKSAGRLVADLTEEQAALNADVQVLQAIRRVLRADAGDTAVQLDAGDRALHDRFAKAIEEAGELALGLGPAAMIYQSVGAVRGFYPQAHTKGKNPDNVEPAGAFDALRDAFDYTTNFERVMAALTTQNLDAVGNNLGQTARDDVRTMDDFGRTVTAAKPTVSSMLDLLENADTRPLARAVLFPQVMERDFDGALRPKLLVGKSLRSLLSGTTHKDLFPKNGRLSQDAALRYLALVEATARKHGGHFSVQRAANDLAIARTSAADHVLTTAELEQLVVGAYLDIAQVLQAAGSIAAVPVAPGTDPLAGLLDQARDAQRQAHKAAQLGLKPGEDAGLVDTVLEQLAIERENEAELDKQALLDAAGRTTDSGEVARIQQQIIGIDVDLDRFHTRLDLLKSDDLVGKVVHMFSIPADPAAAATTKTALVDYVLSHLSILERSSAAMLTLRKLTNQLLDSGRAGQVDLSDAEWAEVSNAVIAVYIDDVVATSASGISVPPFPDADHAEDHRYYDTSFTYLLEPLMSAGAPLVEAAREIHLRADRNTVVATDAEVLDLLGRTVFKDFSLGTWTSDIPRASIEANQRLDSAAAAPAIAMAGNSPKRQAVLSAATRRTFEVPGDELLSEATLSAVDLARDVWDDVEVTLPTGVTSRPLAQLNNRFARTVTLNYTTPEGSSEQIDLLAADRDLGRVWYGNDVAAATGLQEIHLDRVRRAVDRVTAARGIDPLGVKVHLTFFHPDSQPAGPEWANNLFFEGTSFKLDADQHESLNATLWFAHGSISPTAQAAALDASKLGKPALQVVPTPDAETRRTIEADWMVDLAAVLRAKTRVLLESELGFGKLDPEFFNAVYKNLKLRHFVSGQREGQTVLYTAEQVIAMQQAADMSELETISPQLWVPSDDVLRSLLGEPGTQGVARLLDTDLDIDLSRVPTYRGVTEKMLQQFAALSESADLADTRVAHRARQSQLTVRAMLTDAERSAYDAKMLFFREQQADAWGDRAQIQRLDDHGGFSPSRNLAAALRAGDKMLRAENIAFDWSAAGIPFIGPRNPSDTELSKMLLHQLSATLEADGFRTGWVYREGSPANPPAGQLSEVALSGKARPGFRVVPGDLVVLELDSFAGDGDLAARRVDYMVDHGATVVLGATDGQGDLRAELAEHLEASGYTRVAGSGHVYVPAVTTERYQNQRARSSTLVETRGVSTRSQLAILALPDHAIEENAAWANTENERLGAIAVSMNLLPTDFLAGFNVPVEQFSNASQIDRVRSHLRGLDSAEGRTMLREMAADPKWTDEERATADAALDGAIDRLLQRFDTNPGSVLPEAGDEFGTGDLIPLVDGAGRVLLYRHGMQAPTREAVDKMTATALPGKLDAANVAIFPTRPEPAATTHRGIVQSINPRSGYGLSVELDIPLQVFGDKKVLEWNGMKYLLTPRPDSLALPEHGFFANGWGIDLVTSAHDLASKESFEGLVNNHRNAFAYFGIDFLGDVARFFGTDERSARELLHAVATRAPRIQVAAADELVNAERLGASFTSLLGDFAALTSDLASPDWVARLGDLRSVEAKITSAMLVYLMTPGARVADVLASGGFNDDSTDVDAQSVLMPRLFTQVFDNAPLGSDLRTEINRRLNAQLHNPNPDGTGYRLHQDWTFEVRNSDRSKDLRGFLQFAEAHSAGDNPVKNGMAFDPTERSAVSAHSAAIAYQAIGADTAYRYDIAKARTFASGAGVERFTRDTVDGGVWRMLTGIKAEDRAAGVAWRAQTPAEAERRGLARDAVVQFRQPINTIDANGWSEKQRKEYGDLARQIVRTLGLQDSQAGLVDGWVRQVLGMPHGEDAEGNELGKVTGKGALEAGKDILWNVQNRYLPTVGAEVPLTHVDDLQLIFRVNDGKPRGWRPRESMDTEASAATTWDDWVTVSLGTALTADTLFDPLYLVAIDGFMHTYQNATRSLLDLPVSMDALVTQQLLDPETNRLLVSLDDNQDLIAAQPVNLDFARATLDDLIGGNRIAGKYQGKSAPASEVAKRRAKRRAWRKENGVPIPVDVTMRNFRKNGAEFVDHSTVTNALARGLINLRVGTALLNPALYVSMGPEQWYRGVLDRSANLLTGQSTAGTGARLAAKAGLSVYTPEQLTKLNRLTETLGQRNDFKAMVYQSLMFLRPHEPGVGRIEKWLENYAKFGSRIQDPTWGMRAKTLARRYLEAALQHINATPTLHTLTTDQLVAEMSTDPAFLKTNYPEAHQAATNAIAQLRSLKATPLSLSLRGIYEPMSESTNSATNFLGNVVLRMPLLFSGYAMNVLTTITGAQGFSDMTAMFLEGRKKGPNSLFGRIQAKLAGREFNPETDAEFDMSSVLEGIDLSRSFIRGGLTHTGLFALGLMAGGLGLSGEDDETRKRRRMSQLQGAGFVYDPRRLENDFRNADAVFLDWLPFGFGHYFAVANDTVQGERDMGQLHWMLKQFISPIMGMERFYETGDFRHVTWGFEDALGSFPLINTLMWDDAVESAHELATMADNEAKLGGPSNMVASAMLLTNAVGVYERMLFENSFVNQLYTSFDRYDRDPYVLPLRDSDGTIQRDIEGNARPQDLAFEQYVDPETGEVKSGYLGRPASSATMHALTENRATLAFAMSMFTGLGDSDYLRKNMPIKTREAEKPAISQAEAEAMVRAFSQGVGGQANLTADEISSIIKARGRAAGEWLDYDKVDAAAAGYAQHQGPAPMSVLDKDGREVLTKDGAWAVFRGVTKGSVKLGDQSLAGIHIPFEMRETIQKEWMAELIAEGMQLGLDQTKATSRMKRLWYGPTTDPSVQGLGDILWSKDISYSDTITYNQLNTTYVLGPDGRPWATGFTRAGVMGALGLKPVARAYVSEQGATSTDGRLNTTDLINNRNTGLRALELVDDSRNVPTDVEIGKAIEKAIEEAAKADYTPFTPFSSAKSGRGYYRRGGGYRRGGYGGGYGGGGYASFQRMYNLPGGVSPYGNSIPFINTSNPIIRRADVRRERVWSERGRLKQWQ